jgi:hypothetical protein
MQIEKPVSNITGGGLTPIRFSSGVELNHLKNQTFCRTEQINIMSNKKDQVLLNKKVTRTKNAKWNVIF